jgi:cytochrome P450
MRSCPPFLPSSTLGHWPRLPYYSSMPSVASNLPPGPKGRFLLGSAPDLAHDWPGFSKRCARDFGDIAFYRFLHVPICQLTHPDDIESVLVRNASSFHKSRDYAALQFILGSGLLTNEGSSWQAQRQLIQPAFRHENIAAYAEIMAASAAAHLSRWHDQQTCDLHHEMAHLTLEIVTKSLFGSTLSHDTRAIGVEIAAVMERFFSQAALSFILPDGFPIPKSPRLLRSRRHLNRVIFSIIRDRRASQAPVSDLLQTLLDARDDRGACMSDFQLRDEIMTLFLAGHETTANALTWTCYLLAQNPAVVRSLLAELDQVLRGHPPALSDLPRLPYTEMVIKESMRLYPPAWGIGRRTLRNFEIRGYTLPAGTNVFIMQWLTHRDPRFFPDPERFDPERWRTDPVRSGQIPRFAYFPFGGGPRVCIGAGFAMLEATLLLATIAQGYRFTLLPDPPVVPFFSITLRPRYGLPVRLSARTAAQSASA